jgi:hypothetical protein
MKILLTMTILLLSMNAASCMLGPYGEYRRSHQLTEISKIDLQSPDDIVKDTWKSFRAEISKLAKSNKTAKEKDDAGRALSRQIREAYGIKIRPLAIDMNSIVKSILMKTDNIKVIKSGYSIPALENRSKRTKKELYVIFETSNDTDINCIVNQFEFSNYRPSCECGGDMDFAFFGNDNLLIYFSYHHGVAIRLYKKDHGSPIFRWDLILTEKSQKAFVSWLKERGLIQ